MTLTDEQRAIKDVVGSLLSSQWGDEQLVEHASGESSSSCIDVAEQLRDLGITELVVEAGLPDGSTGWREVCLVAEELGAHLSPLNLKPLAVLAALTATAPEHHRLAQLVRDAASGMARLLSGEPSTVPVRKPEHTEGPELIALDAAIHATDCPCRPAADEESWVVLNLDSDSSPVPCVARLDGVSADGGRELGAAEQALDPSRRLHPVRLATAEPLAGVDPRQLAIAAAVGDVVHAAEQSGVARRALEQAVGYAVVREQFGRPIGSFQAVKHLCADMFVRREAADALVAIAAEALDVGDPEARRLAASARLAADEAARRNSADNIQVHGGIGFTWEHTAHLAYKRAIANGLLDDRALPARAALRLELLRV